MDNWSILSEEELVAQVVLFYFTGHETTVNLISGGILALVRNPDQLDLLHARPDLAVNAVEELLRYDGPVQASLRITRAPHTVRGKTIPAGTFVVASLAAANRDPDHWGPDADALRLNRPGASENLTFGGGIHHCLGAALARLEGRIAIGSFVRRFPRISLAADPTWNGRTNLRGLGSLPLTLKPSP